MSTAAKKFRSNWFRIAVEGATTDKRNIKRDWLEQAAANFNQQTYGARIWLEHFRSILPDSPFKAFGDVLAVKAEDVTINGQKKLALFAQISPTDELVAMNKKRQKIYTSAEIDETFADTGEAYLVGLAVTDSPASLGTDVLTFSMEKPESSPFKDRHYSASSMFTEATETEITFEEMEPDKPGLGLQLLTKVKDLLKGKQAQDDQTFAQIGQAVEAVADHVKDLPDQFNKLQKKHDDLTTDFTQLSDDYKAFKQKLDGEQDPGQPPRPAVTGGNQQQLTDC